MWRGTSRRFRLGEASGVSEKGRFAGAVAAVLKPGDRFAVVNWRPRPREETTVLGRPRGPKTEMRMTPAAVAAAVEPAGPGAASRDRGG